MNEHMAPLSILPRPTEREELVEKIAQIQYEGGFVDIFGDREVHLIINALRYSDFAYRHLEGGT